MKTHHTTPILCFWLFVCSLFSLQAQDITTTIRGRIIDAQSKTAVVGANVVVLETNPLQGGTSDVDGYYRIDNVKVGRVTLRISFIGYEEITVPNVLLTSGKEAIYDFEMQEALDVLQELVITDESENKGEVNNEMTTVSTRTFDVDDTRRFAGSRNDPARMASNFAGVTGNNDSRNDIIVRGNSPSGLLWRLEGVDIFNPNHFGSLGATGGPVSILNNNTLAKSDFMTGAFPSMYGNGLAGVFDLKMRKGNNETREYTGQLGFNGLELGAEGPFSKNSRASYMVNYRYSTVEMLAALGWNFGAGTAIPKYQDGSFKIDVPTKSLGRFTLFGVGGFSYVNFEASSEPDTTNFYVDNTTDIYYGTKMGVLGMSHTHYFDKKTYGELILSMNLSNAYATNDTLDKVTKTPFRIYLDDSKQTKATLSYAVSRKFSAKSNATLGTYIYRYNYQYIDSVFVPAFNEFRVLHNSQGDAWLTQAYLQWQYRFSDRSTLNAGLHYQQFTLGKAKALEPRLGFRYNLNAKSSLSLATGLHSQAQNMQLYFRQTTLSDGSHLQTNKDLGFTKSAHFVAAYDLSFKKDWRIKVESYYQHLYQVPVEYKQNYYSVLNEGTDFLPPNVDSLENTGFGRNYGFEFTLEKFFSQNYYMLFTGSLYEAKVKSNNDIWVNSSFNGRYTVNMLFGKEFPLGSKGKSTLGIDTKITLAGGRPYTPILLDQSLASGTTVYDYSQFNAMKYKDYFRCDVKLTYRLNSKKVTQEWFIDVQNVFDTQNIFTEYFDEEKKRMVTVNQLGLFPNINYRIQF